MHKLLMAALVAVVLAGCSSTPTTEEGAPIEDKSATAGAGATTAGTGTAGASTAGVSGTTVPGGTGSGASALRDPSNILSKRSIYFDFDSFVVRDEFRPVVDAHAKYLAGNRSARLTIQGNTDERGSREYNIALAQRRADAVKRMMTLQGVQDAQIETVSFGKEKPKNPGHDEGAWAENRRADLLYAGE
jgi:peptidoglycan-associated lipoprotein